MSKFFRKNEPEPRPPMACGHTGCPHPAVTVLKIQGWTYLCKAHYEFHVQREADEFCRANNLITKQDKIAYIHEKLKSSKFLRHMREPGEEG